VDIISNGDIMYRKMIKWKPFNTLLKYKDILEIEKKRQLVDKPVIMEDRIYEINDVLKSVNSSTLVRVKYFNKGMLLYKEGYVSKIDTIEKYILIDRFRIYFRELIKIEVI
jgi:hypothetical protein